MKVDAVAKLQQERDELRDTLEEMAAQFAYQSVIKGKRYVTTGGLSALESCFSILGWADPHPCDDLLQGCEHPGCSAFATCGTPTNDGYKHCCGDHYREYQSSKNDEV